jgi:hypothetical protein
VDKGKIFTKQLYNKLADKLLIPESQSEFQLRISPGTNVEGEDVLLNSSDFSFKKVLSETPNELRFLLKNKEHLIDVELIYELGSNSRFLNKYLQITSQKPVVLERIDVETISFDDIYQPYQIKQITAQGPAEWRPGLGQPLYTKETATFWGLEFPASYNFVSDKTGYCGYLWGNELQINEP